MRTINSTVPSGPWPHEAVAEQVVQPGTGTVPDVNVFVVDGLSSAPEEDDIEAWAAKLSGEIPLGFREIEDTVAIDYEWLISGTDADGNALPTEHVAVTAGGLTESALTLVARPVLDVMEEGHTPLGNSTLCIQARVRVRLAVSGADSGWVSIPPEPICIALTPLAVPEVAALFRDKNFSGNAILVSVPAASKISGSGELLSVIAGIRPIVERLEQAAALTAWAAGVGGLVGAVRQLATRVPTVANLGFRQQDKHDDLGKYNFIHRSWPRWNDDIEDRASSALAITVNRIIVLYEHDNRGGERLGIDARPSRAGQLGGATIADLHANTPTSAPPGAVLRSGAPDDGWGDTISSYRWESDW